jgi:hypothetical protein
MVAAFLPVSGPDSKWDERGGNSIAVRNTEIMMECNDCLFEGWNEQTAKTHIEMWPDKSEVETHIVRIGHILDKPEGDKMLGDPGVCHHCHCPASHFLRPSSNFAPKQGKAIFRKVVEVAAKHRQHIGRDEEGKRIWLGSQQAYATARAEAGGVHLVFNPLPGIIHQDSHQQMIFDALHGMDKGVLPFTMRASMTMCVAFEESIGCKGLTIRRIQQRMANMAGPYPGHVPGQLFHEKFSLMFSLSKHCQRTFMYIHNHKGETHCTVRGCDMQLILLVMPFVLYNFFEDEVKEWNQQNPLNRKIDPTGVIIPVVTELLDFYQLLRMKGKDLVEIPEMDRIGRNFLDMSRETFKNFTVGKVGQEKHICSSEKMHRIVHCATQAASLGDLVNTEAMSEIIHRTAVRGPQHLVSRSDMTGPGLLKVAQRKEGSRMMMEAHTGLQLITHKDGMPVV